MRIVAAESGDVDWLADASTPLGGPVIVARGRLHDVRVCAGLIARGDDGARLGFASWVRSGTDAELLAIHALALRAGVGSALLAAVLDAAADAGCAAAIVETTADNAAARAFYRARGFTDETVRADAFDEVRRLKGIDADVFGADGRPIRDMVAFRMTFRR